MTKENLDNAYALGSAAEVKTFYADWAKSYDADFVSGMDFIAPAGVAGAFLRAGGKGPVLDFGCGTGVMAEHLSRAGVGPIDGADLSQEMLDVAAAKTLYRDLICGNVLDGYDMPGAPYQGVVSSGTFTHGHVGPEAIPILMRLAASGAVFALSVHRDHFRAAGFQAVLDSLAEHITDLQITDLKFYGPNATGPHKDDVGHVVTFCKR